MFKSLKPVYFWYKIYCTIPNLIRSMSEGSEIRFIQNNMSTKHAFLKQISPANYMCNVFHCCFKSQKSAAVNRNSQQKKS